MSEMVGEEGEAGQKVVEAVCMDMSFCSPLPTVTSFPSTSGPLVPEAGKTPKLRGHCNQPNSRDPRKGSTDLCPIAYSEGILLWQC